jgi:TrpR-related protein YerC/YecD
LGIINPMTAITDQEKTEIWTKLKDPEPLYQAFLSLETVDELKAFFRDLMTEKEIVEFDMRWRIVRMLDSGMTFAEIEAKTGISPITITRINKWLREGCGGYRAMIDKLGLHKHK